MLALDFLRKIWACVADALVLVDKHYRTSLEPAGQASPEAIMTRAVGESQEDIGSCVLDRHQSVGFGALKWQFRAGGFRWSAQQ